MEKRVLSQLTALAHDRRLAVFRLLMRRFPDALPAGEVARALGLKASTLSVYLGALRAAGLITQERHGTSLCYRADTAAAGGLVGFLFEECCRSRPDITCLPNISQTKGKTMTYNVLFICSGNSARSIFAECILREIAPDRFTVFSAGTRPNTELNPFAIRMLAAKGHDISHLRSKHISEFQGEGAPVMDFVFTVCDRAANENCPAWRGQPISGHWGQPDPVKATGTDAEKTLAFQQVYGALHNRIHSFSMLPLESLDRVALQSHVDRIGSLDGSGA
ncbi:helix-turn-helix domain-containing protein [Puniceibacterium sp. IMCC21224]|uniref:arsenate reductase/protein-tyrosine-phosphatase family protein n=1 Tax=Puniceibacterium sp. IMCC21224 TaxID=1618204 RepID=UPI00064E08D5|nr:helix-turn-helix domain-containing protein [Puniceibacterium sp. IMCC21224]KMK67613.1 transcriptional regulator, ArsR family [Puniceibacterium sp. IMCC21224]